MVEPNLCPKCQKITTQKEKRELLGRYLTNKKIKISIDKLLRQMATLESTLGNDSTKKDVTTIRKEQKQILNKIKKLDPIKAKRIYPAENW